MQFTSAMYIHVCNSLPVAVHIHVNKTIDNKTMAFKLDRPNIKHF